MLPVIIDVEASGFGRGSYPIEVGVALASGFSRCMIIRREPEWQHWDSSAEDLHGISREILENHGREALEVANCLNEWLRGEIVYSDAWGNDSSWLALLFDTAGISQQFKLESIRSLLSEEQLEVWHQVKDDVVHECELKRHRASGDALILQQVYSKSADVVAQQQCSCF